METRAGSQKTKYKDSIELKFDPAFLRQPADRRRPSWRKLENSIINELLNALGQLIRFTSYIIIDGEPSFMTGSASSGGPLHFLLLHQSDRPSIRYHIPSKRSAMDSDKHQHSKKWFSARPLATTCAHHSGRGLAVINFVNARHFRRRGESRRAPAHHALLACLAPTQNYLGILTIV
ncbi:hypothetical protein EVAR_40997_1 [Eumeta japonica]|uniref:Uncharacterized protein n=1 Tax=Eumeta variegata TaxID=151549 RepID=A0A4C1XI70_EUMVA|nr:hypothetical protein EVAR_40997_1 [Eumeta japonica]